MNMKIGRSGATVTRRAVLTASIVAMAAATLVVTPSPAQAADTFRFVPVSLVAYDLEDPFPDTSDEISLRYGRVDFRPPSTAKGSTQLPPAETFTGPMAVELWELDQGWTSDDRLGSFSVAAAALPSTQFTFNNPDPWSGWRYVLTYRVERVDTKEVPYVIGMGAEDASQLLRAQGFGVTIRYVESCTIDPDTVTGQSPSGGRLVPAGSTVTMYVTYLPDGHEMC
jgi:hypothetical protein